MWIKDAVKSLHHSPWATRIFEFAPNLIKFSILSLPPLRLIRINTIIFIIIRPDVTLDWLSLSKFIFISLLYPNFFPSK